MKLKLYLLLLIVTANFPATFLEKLAKQSTPTKAVLAIAAIFPLLHGAHTQYHLRCQHSDRNECITYSRHHLQNIPYLNLLFYLNQPITLIRKRLNSDKSHQSNCLLFKRQTNTVHIEKPDAPNSCQKNCNQEHFL